MRNVFLVFVLCSMSALSSWAQSTTKAAPAAKAPVHHAAAGQPTAIIETTAGNMTCTLFPDKAPIGVENFIGLATGKKDWKNPVSGTTKHNTPLYDGTIFHRVIPGFMIQGGDPLGTGTGDPGYRFQDEFVDTLKFDRPGRLAMANSGPNTNGSQFFITEDSTHSLHLSGHHTIFGQCDDASIALVKKIARLPKGPDDKPLTPVRIVHLTIVRGGAASTTRHPVVHGATGTTKKPAAGTAPKKPVTPPQ